jgi:hypothetical protein
MGVRNSKGDSASNSRRAVRTPSLATEVISAPVAITRLHGDEDAGDHQNDGGADFPRLSSERHRGELRRDQAWIAEICHRAPLHVGPVALWVGRHGFPQVVFDFAPHALRQRAIAPQPQALLREGRTQDVSAQTLQPCAIVRRHPHVGVQIEALQVRLSPRATSRPPCRARRRPAAPAPPREGPAPPAPAPRPPRSPLAPATRPRADPPARSRRRPAPGRGAPTAAAPGSGSWPAPPRPPRRSAPGKSFPAPAVVLSLMAALGPGLLNRILALPILGAASASRVIRGATLSVMVGRPQGGHRLDGGGIRVQTAVTIRYGSAWA